MTQTFGAARSYEDRFRALEAAGGGVGATGATGPAGPTGATGPTGPNGGGSGSIQFATVEISSADIRAMPGTPKTLIAAPGANKALWLLGYAVKYTHVTTPYESTTFTVIREGSPTPIADPLGETFTSWGFGTKIGSGNDDYLALTDIANKALQLSTLDPTGSAGDGTAEVTVAYVTLPLSP